MPYDRYSMLDDLGCAFDGDGRAQIAAAVELVAGDSTPRCAVAVNRFVGLAGRGRLNQEGLAGLAEFFATYSAQVNNPHYNRIASMIAGFAPGNRAAHLTLVRCDLYDPNQGLWAFHTGTHTDASGVALDKLVDTPRRHLKTLEAAAGCTALTDEAFDVLYRPNLPVAVLSEFAANPALPIAGFAELGSSRAISVRQALLGNPNCPLPILLDAAERPSRSMCRYLAITHRRVAAHHGWSSDDDWRTWVRGYRTHGGTATRVAARLEAAT